MNIEASIDEALLRAAMELGPHETPAEAINAALDEYAKLIKRRRLVRHFGTVDYHPGYPEGSAVEGDPKKAI